MENSVHEAIILIVMDVGMERRDVASDIATALMTREDSPLVRYRYRAERNAKAANEIADEVVNISRETVAQWMLANSFATGHGDTLADLLKELKWQVDELRALAPRTGLGPGHVSLKKP